jgi:hypothetical protein
MYTVPRLQVLKKGYTLRPNEENKSKRGLVKYDHNPFVGNAVANTKQGVKRISNKDGNRMMVVSENTGEIVAPAGFWQAQEVDKTQFVKLYVNGVKAFKDLTGAGTKVFEVLYLRVQESIGKDFLYLSFIEVDQETTPMSKATFMKGMKELIIKGFIAESMVQNKYYLNPDYMWNGDRLAFVKEYRKTPNKQKGEAKHTQTLDLFRDPAMDQNDLALLPSDVQDAQQV